jgi:hypothetical protein
MVIKAINIRDHNVKTKVHLIFCIPKCIHLEKCHITDSQSFTIMAEK